MKKPRIRYGVQVEIPDVLDAVRVLWELHPELRLGQLLENLSQKTLVFYLEDAVLLELARNLQEKSP